MKALLNEKNQMIAGVLIIVVSVVVMLCVGDVSGFNSTFLK